jgi:ABC-type uncharacterized transport system ATPase subunit
MTGSFRRVSDAVVLPEHREPVSAWFRSAAKVLAAVSQRAEVLDLTGAEPEIADVVRRIYAAQR